MDTSEARPPSIDPRAKLPWTPPVVTLTGAVTLLVRAGSALGKGREPGDGDAGQFQARGQSG